MLAIPTECRAQCSILGQSAASHCPCGMQVLEQLQQSLSLTYSAARTAAVQVQQRQTAATTAVLPTSTANGIPAGFQTVRHSTTGIPEQAERLDDTTSSPLSSAGSGDGRGKDVLSKFVADLQLTADEEAAAAAVAALKEMRDWVAEQDMRMVEVRCWTPGAWQGPGPTGSCGLGTGRHTDSWHTDTMQTPLLHLCTPGCAAVGKAQRL